MSKRQLLFVTYQDENFDEGMSYAVELAKAMDEDITLLMAQKKDSLSKKFENLMAGVAFAEEGEHETAGAIAAGASRAAVVSDARIADLVVKCSKEGVHLMVQNTDKDVVAAVRSFVKQDQKIDKVVLSPVVTESEILTTKDLNRLVRTASRPVVTMTRQSIAAMREGAKRSKSSSSMLQPSASY